MAFKVEHYGAGFRISTGDRKPAKARNIGEVKRALEHYYTNPYHSIFLEDCPFCQQMNGEGLTP